MSVTYHKFTLENNEDNFEYLRKLSLVTCYDQFDYNDDHINNCFNTATDIILVTKSIIPTAIILTKHNVIIFILV